MKNKFTEKKSYKYLLPHIPIYINCMDKSNIVSATYTHLLIQNKSRIWVNLRRSEDTKDR